MTDRKGTTLIESGQKVAVLGLGVSGTAAARLAQARGARVYASDAFDNPRLVDAARTLRAEGIDAEAGRHDMEKVLAADLVVTSPGIDPSTEVRRTIREAGLRTVAEIELAYRELRSRVIGITGTNGKTTTTALCGHLLAESGVDAVTAGNIGKPLSEVAQEETQPDWVVVELSSFQLADLELFRPDVGVLLNLAPDHLDRYASLDQYYEDKRRLFYNADDDSSWVYNADDAEVTAMTEGVTGRSFAATLGDLDGPGAHLDDEGWLVQRLNGETVRWCRAAEVQLVGRHNTMNALLAGLAAALVGCAPEAIGTHLQTFEGLPHRLQRVGEYGGMIWINDSKATNVSATRVALGAFDQPVIAILGGRHKGEPYAALVPALKRNVRAVVTFGEAAPRILRELGDLIEVRVEGSIESVVRAAHDAAEPGDVVLFSPACSSYDMFPNYAARGAAFEAAVRELGDA